MYARNDRSRCLIGRLLAAAILASALIMTSSAAVFAQIAPPTADPEAAAQQRVATLEEQADLIRTEIARLNHELELIIESFNSTRVKLDELTMQLADSRSRLDAMRARHAREEQELSNRIVSIYKAGEVNVLEVLINSGGFNDFYVQMGYLKKVNEQDYKLKEQYKHSANQISDLTDEIDARRSEQLSLERTLARQKEQVEALIAAREARLGQVNGEVQKILQAEAERQLQEQLQARAEAQALLDELEISDSVQAEVVLTALQFLGVPYVWGGESPEGFDCSGLTKYVYARHGVNLPHYAASQYQMGVPVPDEMLQPGDLIFWGPGHPHHVGMYIGQGKYIEASGFGEMVKISTLTFDADYAGARRFALRARAAATPSS